MKNEKNMYLRLTLLLGFTFMVSIGCERDLSDEVEFATFPSTAEIFTDAPVGLGTDFYFPFGPDAGNPVGSKFTAWSVDDETSYKGTSSMRIDVPNANDPEGNYAGGILRIDGAGRDLSDYDALTFWAKASQGANIGEIGFGEDFGENKFVTTLLNVSVSTQWTKFTIPIPDASRLTNVRGMLRYSAGAINDLGYTFWIDELRFEKLGTVAQPRPAIQSGTDAEVQSFLGDQVVIMGLTQTFNLASGGNETVSAAPSYFSFNSSDASVAQVSELGVVTILSIGTAKITASLGGVPAQGSLTLNVTGSFDFAPVPTRPASNVISIFSDAYSNVPVDFYNGFWEPFQTTLSADFFINGDNILNYTNFNFVGNQFSNPTVDATGTPNFHVDLYIPGAIDPAYNLLITLKDFGADGADGGGDDEIQQIFFASTDLVGDAWNSFDTPITLTNRNRIGQIIYENINFSPLSNFYVDNVYFYSE
ncbi:Ig-like domain-containing protein [Maribacter sp.]|nr:Ig-like domain-containing protein [Maribacter sp.]